MDNSQKLNFINCPACNSQGFMNGKKCHQCRGLGMVLPFYGYYLYWGKPTSRLTLLVDKSTKVIDKIINILLAILGLSGVIVLLFFAWQQDFINLIELDYWLTPSWEKAFFWFTFLTDLYLFYRFRKQNFYDKKVFPRVFVKEPIEQVPQDWQYILSQPRRLFIDISKAFEEPAVQLVESSWELAKEFGHAKVARIHLFAVLPQFKQGAVIWGRLGINLETFKQKISRVLNSVEETATSTEYSEVFYKILFSSYLKAYEQGKRKVDITELVLSLVDLTILNKYEKADDWVEKILIDLDLNYQKVVNVAQWIRIQRLLRENLQRFRAKAKFKPKSGLDRAMTAVVTPFLDQFSTDLTKMAKLGQLFPCLGRDQEFEEIFRVMEGSREGVLLVGQPGVGRTSILYGLAQKMVEETVPPELQDKRLVSISIAKILSGASAAQAEERIMTLANEVSKARNIILAIEDIHNLYGITIGTEVSMDLSDVFAELLSKELFHLIATTTPDNYTKLIENSSLAERFRKVNIEELEINDAIQVLEAKSGPIEYKHNVFFSYDSIEKSALLTSRYIHDRYLPEKALDIMEEVAVKVQKSKGQRAMITGEDVSEVIADKTGLKVTKITQKESEKLLNLEDEIHQRVVGQDEAVKMVASSLRRARAQLREEKRPIASLLFLGPTGVGKTELAKTVAQVYFGNEKNMLRFDMSEFQNQASLSRLIGSSQDPGLLTEAVRKNPFSLILFDEVEKAHPDILNVFLQVMDDGRLTDYAGRTIDFTNTIIIMTSNAGAQIIQDEIKKNTKIDKLKEILLETELREHFKPELINRFDGVVVFKPLTMEQVIAIARILSKKVIDRLAKKDITLKITDQAIAELAELGFDPKFGARPLRRVIQERVDDTLANYLLQNKISKRDTVYLEPGGQLKIEKAEEI